jgi:hypothetical protein
MAPTIVQRQPAAVTELAPDRLLMLAQAEASDFARLGL